MCKYKIYLYLFLHFVEQVQGSMNSNGAPSNSSSHVIPSHETQEHSTVMSHQIENREILERGSGELNLLKSIKNTRKIITLPEIRQNLLLVTPFSYISC